MTQISLLGFIAVHFIWLWIPRYFWIQGGFFPLCRKNIYFSLPMAMPCKGLMEYFYELIPFLTEMIGIYIKCLVVMKYSDADLFWIWFPECRCCFGESFPLSRLRPQDGVESIGFLLLGRSMVPLQLVSSTRICIY